MPIGNKLVDLAGQRFNRLTVLSRAGKNRWRSILWLCRCDCGNTKSIRGYDLKKGYTQSCGCSLWGSKGYIYLMLDSKGEYKIGYSGNPKGRVKGVKKERKDPKVKLVLSIKADKAGFAEQMLHRRFDTKRKSGEWFKLSQIDVNFIKSIASFKNGRFILKGGREWIFRTMEVQNG